jgi:DNA-binding MarR family transcriptional regulator
LLRCLHTATERSQALAFEPPQLEELLYLYERLSVEERDELLQRLLITPPRGERPMIKRLEERPFCCSTTKVLGERGDA